MTDHTTATDHRPPFDVLLDYCRDNRIAYRSNVEMKLVAVSVNGTAGYVGATGLFSLELDGNNDLFLKYTGAGAAVPEPGTWAAAALLVAASRTAPGSAP